MHRPSLAIDLGASYTKIGYCGPLKERSRVESSLVSLDDSVIIPSLAIHTNRKDQRWLFGVDAANTTPSGKMQVFKNWKADLFGSSVNKETTTAILVAGEFFNWLRGRLDEHEFDLSDVRIRLALPAFDGMEHKASIIAQVMALNGWHDLDIRKVTEPRANMLGVFTHGRNYLGRDGHLQFGGMYSFNNPAVQRGRRLALVDDQTSRFMRVLVVDIGAFTTDAALITYDISAADDGVTDTSQNSWEYGIIRQLDERILPEIVARHKLVSADYRFDDWEKMKRSIYAGESYALPNRSDQMVTVGDADDQILIDATLGVFAQDVFAKVQTWIGNKKAEYLYLTGGGSLIARLSKALAVRFSTIGATLHELPDPGIKKLETGLLVKWRETEEGLSRLATALGGVSVILDAPATERRAELRPPAPMRRPPGPAQIKCRCDGGNKDCCFCGGKGFYIKYQ